MALLLPASKRQLCRSLTPNYIYHHYQHRLLSDEGQTTTTTTAKRTTNDRMEYLLTDAVVHRRGDDDYGSREYVLLPSGLTLAQLQADPALKLASIYAHRNILFGARSYVTGASLIRACEPIFDVALPDASAQGEQPQAMSTLHGLCRWVKQQSEAEHPTSRTMQQLFIERQNQNFVAFDAVVAIATGVPRKGHGMLGAGTLRDGQEAWEKLAKEFCQQGGSEEVQLYQAHGAEVVGIEYLADKSEAYMKSAGGSMARMFFV